MKLNRNSRMIIERVYEMPKIKVLVRLSRPQGQPSASDEKWISSITALNDMTEGQRRKVWREFWKNKRR
jgi:hypothetical protein